MAFAARLDGKNSLWIRSLDKLEATVLRGTDGAFFPFWSPDGAYLAFFMRGKLWRMDLNASAPVAICDALEPRGGSWGSANVIVFAPGAWGPIAQVPAEGGTPKPVTKTGYTNQGVSDRWPSFLPDGRHFLFVHTPNGAADERDEIHFASLDGEKDKVLFRGRFYAVRYASGWLLADRGGSLLAWKFDPSSGKISGDAVQVVDKIASDDLTAGATFSVSAQGDLLYQQGPGATGERHEWLDAIGKQLAKVSEPGVYGGTRLSSDGSRIATPVIGQSGNVDLWMWDLAGGTRARLSSGDAVVDTPVWSADGRTLYFGSSDNTTSHQQIREVPTDGSQPERILIKTGKEVSPADCSSDGKWLLLRRNRGRVSTDCGSHGLSSDQRPGAVYRAGASCPPQQCAPETHIQRLARISIKRIGALRGLPYPLSSFQRQVPGLADRRLAASMEPGRKEVVLPGQFPENGCGRHPDSERLGADRRAEDPVPDWREDFHLQRGL